MIILKDPLSWGHAVLCAAKRSTVHAIGTIAWDATDLEIVEAVKELGLEPAMPPRFKSNSPAVPQHRQAPQAEVDPLRVV